MGRGAYRVALAARVPPLIYVTARVPITDGEPSDEADDPKGPGREQPLPAPTDEQKPLARPRPPIAQPGVSSLARLKRVSARADLLRLTLLVGAKVHAADSRRSRRGTAGVVGSYIEQGAKEAHGWMGRMHAEKQDRNQTEAKRVSSGEARIRRRRKPVII